MLRTLSLRTTGEATTRHTSARWVLALTCLIGLTTAAGAAAQWGGGGSLYTENGVEITVDGRVSAVFVMLNALGYDDETLRGPPPLSRPRFTDARSKARSSLGRPGSGLRAFEKAVEANPSDVGTYVEAALSLGAVPRFEAPKGASKMAKAVSEPLRAWFNEEGGSTVTRSVADLSRDALMALRTPVNDVTKTLAKEIRIGDEEEQLLDDTGPQGRVVVAVNLLDAHGTLHRVKLGDTTTVVVGPTRDKADIERATHAAALSFARTLVEREAMKAAGKGTLADRFDTLSATTRAHSATRDAKSFAAELVACGLVRALVAERACDASPLARDPAAEPLVTLMQTRARAFIDDTMLLGEAAPTLLASETAAAPPAEAMPTPPAPAVTPPPPAPGPLPGPLPPKAGVKKP